MLFTPVGTTFKSVQIPPIYIFLIYINKLVNSSLSRFNANRIYKLIKKLSRENNYKRISLEIFRNDTSVKEISNYDLDNGLNELVNAGYLLMHKNYTEFELV